jgi:hypothetical protein
VEGPTNASPRLYSTVAYSAISNTFTANSFNLYSSNIRTANIVIVGSSGYAPFIQYRTQSAYGNNKIVIATDYNNLNTSNLTYSNLSTFTTVSNDSGQTFTSSTLLANGGSTQGLAYSNNVFVMSSGPGGAFIGTTYFLKYSTDGINWNLVSPQPGTVSSPTTLNYFNVQVNNNGNFMVYGYNSNGANTASFYSTSSDGINWVSSNVTTSFPTLGSSKFIIINSNLSLSVPTVGAGDRMWFTTDNGLTFSQYTQAFSAPNYLNNGVYIPNYGVRFGQFNSNSGTAGNGNIYYANSGNMTFNYSNGSSFNTINTGQFNFLGGDNSSWGLYVKTGNN